MATARDMVTASLRVLGLGNAGFTYTADELEDARAAMNRMLAKWQTDNLLIPWRDKVTFTVTNGKSEYTWGTGGDFDDVRPVHLFETTFLRDISGQDHIVAPMTARQWQKLEQKDQPARPRRYYYEPNFPLAYLRFANVPTLTEQFTADVLKPLIRFTSLDTVYQFMEEFEEPIIYNLAMRLAPEYGKEASKTVMAIALAGVKDLKRKIREHRTMVMEPDAALRFYGIAYNYYGYNINRG